MTHRRPDKIATLFFNTGPTNREACRLVMSSGLPYQLLATYEEDTPKLAFGYDTYVGVEKIRSFLSSCPGVQMP